jgi:glucose-6-phosphate isomerase
MPKGHTIEPLLYGVEDLLDAKLGIDRRMFDALTPRLYEARDRVLLDLQRLRSGERIEPELLPLDADFIDTPQKLLSEFGRDGTRSTLGRIQSCAARLSRLVDSVVVVGIGGSYLGARSLFQALSHPYHNELPPKERNNRPRIYFAGYNVDNDSTRGLLDVLESQSRAGERWGMVVVSKSGETLEPLIGFRLFHSALQDSLRDEPELLKQIVVAVTGPGSELSRVAREIHCEVFEIPERVGGRFSVLTAVGLLPGALMGIDIRGLLSGAHFATERFKVMPCGQNPALDYACVGHLAEKELNATIRVLATWYEPLEAFGLWYDQLLSESLGKSGMGTTPLTVVNTRDLHSRGQQHQEGRRDKLITNLVAKRVRMPVLALGRSDHDIEDLNEFADRTLPSIMAAARSGTNRAYREDGRLTVDLELPGVDAISLGQLYQTLMLATVAEGRLIGVNPYGQPGVEAYKRYMRIAMKNNIEPRSGVD